MITQKKLVLFFLFLIVLLLLRDLPYFNVLVIERLWIIYLLLIIVGLFYFIPKRTSVFFFGAFSLIFIAAVFNFVGIAIIPEIIGIIIYGLLWTIVLQKIIYLVRSSRHNNDT